jgi:CRP-like cAMP-binding protein
MQTGIELNRPVDFSVAYIAICLKNLARNVLTRFVPPTSVNRRPALDYYRALLGLIKASALPKNPNMKSKRHSPFDPQLYLDSVGVSRKMGDFRKNQTIFTQGDEANAVIYIQKGSVKLTVVNERGKEAVVAIYGSGDFFGEGAIAGESIRLGTAQAVVPTSVLMIGKKEMIRVLHSEHLLSDRFIAYMPGAQ